MRNRKRLDKEVHQVVERESHRAVVEKRVQFRPMPVFNRESETGAKIVEGYASVFYDPNDPGTEYSWFDGVVERIMPGAFNESLINQVDVVCLFNHDFNLLLGRTASQTLRLAVDPKGLKYNVDIDDTTHGQDTWKMAKRNDIRGSSFGFYPKETKYIDRDDGVLVIERHVVELVDVSPVSNPAYQSTEAWARSRSATERELHRIGAYEKVIKWSEENRAKRLQIQQLAMRMNSPVVES